MISRTKFGDCEQCGDKNTNVIKVGKSTYCIHCRNAQKAKEYTERAKDKSKVRSLISDNGMGERQSLINDLDYVFSRYIRIRESDARGICTCYTCGKKDHWTKLQNGHYIKRAETLLRWDSRNARPQCVECNCNKSGNMDVYTENLNEEHPGLPDQLREESREVNKFCREELKQLLIDYRAKLKIVQQKLL
jgi:hypothetical protein